VRASLNHIKIKRNHVIQYTFIYAEKSALFNELLVQFSLLITFKQLIYAILFVVVVCSSNNEVDCRSCCRCRCTDRSCPTFYGICVRLMSCSVLADDDVIGRCATAPIGRGASRDRRGGKDGGAALRPADVRPAVGALDRLRLQHPARAGAHLRRRRDRSPADPPQRRQLPGRRGVESDGLVAAGRGVARTVRLRERRRRDDASARLSAHSLQYAAFHLSFFFPSFYASAQRRLHHVNIAANVLGLYLFSYTYKNEFWRQSLLGGRASRMEQYSCSSS